MTPKSHVVSTPAMAVPTTLPTAPTAIAMTIETTAMPRVQIALARMTRPRLGTSVNVVRPVRWLHSLVIERIAIIGSTTAIGKPMAAAKLPYVRASSGANRIVATVAITDRMPMLDISQKPERVSNILRSSTAVTVESVIGGIVSRAASRTATAAWGERVVAVMPLLLHVGSLR